MLDSQEFKVRPGTAPEYQKFLKQLEEKLQALRQSAKSKQYVYHQEMKRDYDRRHASRIFRIGDLVKLYIKDQTSALKTIKPYWDAPYRIVGFPDPHGPTMNVVKYPDGTEIKIVHQKNVEPYHLSQKMNEKLNHRGDNVVLT